MRRGPVIVSDHAVLRYLERAHGVPVEAIRTALAGSAAIGVAHDCPVVVLGKVKIVVRDGVVLTVLKRGWANKGRRKRHLGAGADIATPQPRED